MKKIILSVLYAALLTAAGISLAHGDVSTDMQQYLESEVSGADAAFNQQTAPDSAEATVPEGAWFFRRIWLRLRPHLGFSVLVVSVKVIPEVELLWERPYPDSWVNYKK